MKRLTLIGYYGRRNLGDDLMLAGLLEYITRQSVGLRVDVCTAAPLAMAIPSSVRQIVTPSLGGRLAKLESIVRSQVVAWGGGTCLYEDGPGGTTGLEGIARVIQICRLARTRFSLLGVGVGALHTDHGHRLTRFILKNADDVFLRDEESVDRANTIVGWEKGKVCGDLAFLRPPLPGRPRDVSLKPETVIFSGVSQFAGHPNLIASYRRMIAGWISGGVRKVRFLPMHQGPGTDHEMHRLLCDGLPPDSYDLIDYGTLEEACSHISSADLSVSLRLHGVVLADMLRVPCFAVSYSPKVAYYCSKMGDVGLRRLRDLGEEITYTDMRRLQLSFPSHEVTIGGFIGREERSALMALEHFRSTLL